MLHIRYFVSLNMVKIDVFGEGGIFDYKVDGVLFLLIRVKGLSSWWESSDNNHIEESGSYHFAREMKGIISIIPEV